MSASCSVAADGGNHAVNDDGGWRRVIEEQQRVRQQPVAAGDIDHPAATHMTSDPLCHLPGFVQFLARQAANLADRTRQAVKQRRVREAAKIVPRQARTG